MRRFCRKYLKVLLAVGGTFLLIIFLIPTAVTNLGDFAARRGRTMATFTSLAGESETMSAGDFESAQRDLVILTDGLQAGPGESLPLRIALGDTEVEQPAHWLLLVREAEALGLMGGVEDAEVFATRLGEFVGGEQGPAPADFVIEVMAQNSHTSPRDVEETLMRLQGVSRLVNLASPGFKVSPPRLAAVANDVLQGMDALVAVISPPSPDEEEIVEPDAEGVEGTEETTDEPTAISDEELLAQFEKYADVARGEGERGFGYRLPDRVRLEWIEISAESMREAIEQTNMVSGLELRKYWLRRKDQFPAPGSAPGAEAAFEQVQNQVRAALLNELTTEYLGHVERFVEAELTRSTRDLPRDGIYLELPADWADQRVKLHIAAERLQQYIRDQWNIPLALPVYQRPEEWHSTDNVFTIPGLGRATTSEYSENRPQTLRDLLPLLKEFGGSEVIPLQTGVAFGPLRSADGSLHFVRVLESEESHPPATVDEVRDDVLADLERLRGYEELIADLDAIKRLAVEEGMSALSDEYDTFAMPVRGITIVPEGSMFEMYGRGTTMLPLLGKSEEALERIIEHGKSLIQSMLDQGRTIEDLTAEDLTFVLPLDERLSVLVVQFNGRRPVAREDVGMNLMPLQDLIRREEMPEESRGELFSWESMRERYKFESSSGDVEEELAEAEAESADAADASDSATD